MVSLHDLDAGEPNEVAARTVVQDMYRGMKTPFVVRPVTSKPADANALWNEVCKLAEKKQTAMIGEQAVLLGDPELMAVAGLEYLRIQDGNSARAMLEVVLQSYPAKPPEDTPDAPRRPLTLNVIALRVVRRYREQYD